MANSLRPTRIDSARSMLEGGYRLEVWCPRCDVWRQVNLAEMVMRGRGDDSLIGRRWVCRDCGAVGQPQIKPPVPGDPGYDPNNRPLVSK